jgi:hypothetical protein
MRIRLIPLNKRTSYLIPPALTLVGKQKHDYFTFMIVTLVDSRGGSALLLLRHFDRVIPEMFAALRRLSQP